MDYSTVFTESIKLHQRLVDIFVESRDESGFSFISQPEIASKIGRSQTWVASAIKRLNVEEICVESIASGKYMVHYENLLLKGVFSKISDLILDTRLDPTLFYKKDSVIAEEYGFKLRTVQMYKAYLRTGWKVSGNSTKVEIIE